MVKVKSPAVDVLLPLLGAAAPQIAQLDSKTRAGIREIRLRYNQPVTAELGTRRMRLGPMNIDLDELISRFCEYSVHSHAKQLAEGFITVTGGHRVGFCGTAFLSSSGKVESVRAVTSVNIRIAQAFPGCAESVFDIIGDQFNGLLFMGPPMSAKTTVLRDYIRLLSQTRKVCVIDERGEIAAKHGAMFTHDLGPNTDVLDAFPKAAGFVAALRTLSPDFVACDEINDECEQLAASAGTGVGLLLTAHCSGIEQAQRSPQLSLLMSSGRIDYAVLLDTGANIGKTRHIWKIT
jgi:stage III sporulation protein AA